MTASPSEENRRDVRAVEYWADAVTGASGGFVHRSSACAKGSALLAAYFMAMGTRITRKPRSFFRSAEYLPKWSAARQISAWLLHPRPGSLGSR